MMRNEIFCMKNAMHEITNDYETEISELKERVSHLEQNYLDLKQMFLQFISIGKPTKTMDSSFAKIEPLEQMFNLTLNDLSNDTSSAACFRTKDQGICYVTHVYVHIVCFADALSAVYYESDEEAKYERPQYLQPMKDLIKHEENSIEIPLYDGSSTERVNIEYLCGHSQSPHRIRLSGVPEGIEKHISVDDAASYSYNLTPMDASNNPTITGNCLPILATREYNNHLSAPLDIDSPSIHDQMYDYNTLSSPPSMMSPDSEEPLPQEIEKPFVPSSENHLKHKISLFENFDSEIHINRSSTVGSMFVDKKTNKYNNMPSIENRHYSHSLHQNNTIYEHNIYDEKHKTQKRKRKKKRKIQKQYKSATDTYSVGMEGMENFPAVSPPIPNVAKSQQVIRIPTLWKSERLECNNNHVRARTPNIEFSMSTSERQVTAHVSHHKKTRSTTAVSDYMQPLKNRKKLRSFKPMPTLYTSGILRDGQSHRLTNNTLSLRNNNSLKLCMNPEKHHLDDSEHHSSKCCSTNGESNSPVPFVDEYKYTSVLEIESENEKNEKHIFTGVAKKKTRAKKYKRSRKSIHI